MFSVLKKRHPHDDHMGGAAELLNNIEVGKIYGPNFFDVEKITELGWCEEMIDEGYDLDVEIFQASHHGSKTGNIQKFLDAMSPECVVISCGMKNWYNHPTEEVIERFKKMELPVYRTDESGNIVLTTDGSSYSFNVKPGTYTSGKAYKGE